MWNNVTKKLRHVGVAHRTLKLRPECAPPCAMAKAEERSGERVSLSIGTFNVLAPCHKRERTARYEGETGNVKLFNDVIGSARAVHKL